MCKYCDKQGLKEFFEQVENYRNNDGFDEDVFDDMLNERAVIIDGACFGGVYYYLDGTKWNEDYFQSRGWNPNRFNYCPMCGERLNG